MWHALPVPVIVLALYYYWFAIANRYIIFLYYHDMGPLVPDTSPFSPATGGRYWMAGLVAGGAVMLLYTLANWVAGRIAPAWWRVWVLSAGPLVVGIPLITMTLNRPTLPLQFALQSTLAALAGVALALLPGNLAGEKPAGLIWLALDGVALAPVLLLATALADVGRWWASGNMWRVWIVAGGISLGVVGLLIITLLRLWRRTAMPGAAAIFTAGMCVAYLLLPLVHHLFVGLIEGYFYISTASNFFASSVPLQLATWLVAGLVALGVTRIRQKFA